MRVALITPVLIETPLQQERWVEQQYFLNNCDKPTDITLKQFVCGNVAEANVDCPADVVDQVSRRRLLTKAALSWLAEKDDDVKLLHWLDADDVPSAYWFQALRNCNKPLNILAVSERQLITFSKQYMTAGKRAFDRLAQGACGVGCGSAIVWRLDKTERPYFTHIQLKPPYYLTYCGIEDVVLGVLIARTYPHAIGYVTADCCLHDCSQGLPAIYRCPSHKLGVDKRVQRNQLLAAFRREYKTDIQGTDITEGYGK